MKKNLSFYVWVVGLPVFLVGILWQLGYFKVTYEAQVSMIPRGASPKGQTLKVFTGAGRFPAAAVMAANNAANTFLSESVVKEKANLKKRIVELDKRKATLNAQILTLNQERKTARSGSVPRPSAESNAQLDAMKTRRAVLMERYPTHTDIQLLGQQIKAIEEGRRKRSSNVSTRVTDLGRQVAEAQVELQFIARKTLALEKSAKEMQPQWRIAQPASRSYKPARIEGGPLTASLALISMGLAVFLLKRKPSQNHQVPHDTIALSLLMPEQQEKFVQEVKTLAEDPLSRQAATLYERWLKVVQKVYAPNAEPPRQIFESAQPLVKETMAFMGKGHDTLTRHLARVVVEGDLPSHVTRTVLMALLGAYEAGVPDDQQQGMTYAALFHDLSMVPRPGSSWQDIGTEVGRLSANFVRKIPGLPAALVERVEAMLVSMDEHDLKVWQNLPRDKNLEPFANLLRQIDRFDKVAQKQKSRLTRRLASA